VVTQHVRGVTIRVDGDGCALHVTALFAELIEEEPQASNTNNLTTCYGQANKLRRAVHRPGSDHPFACISQISAASLLRR